MPLFEAIDETDVGYVVEEYYEADRELPLRASTSDGSALPEPFQQFLECMGRRSAHG